jgi:hypothetical protein
MPHQFRSDPPPEIDSATYARALNEVKEVGSIDSMERPPGQWHAARD